MKDKFIELQDVDGLGAVFLKASSIDGICPCIDKKNRPIGSNVYLGNRGVSVSESQEEVYAKCVEALSE